MNQIDNDVIEQICDTARRMRRNILDMALQAGSYSSHFGGGLSIADITATLFGAVMKLDPHDPQWSERDRFILSKGHGVLGYYTALAEAGYLSKAELMSFEQPGTDLCGHPVMNRSKGIEFSNGSLGMGLSLGIGVALAGAKRNQDYRVFVLMGDGECNEGSVWEAAMAAPQYRLNNLVAIIDRNNWQQTGDGKSVMDLGDLAAKWRSFGWKVVEVDGHDHAALYRCFSEPNKGPQPLAVVAHTIKGKGFEFSENDNAWHHAILTKANYEAAVQSLEEELADA